MTTHQSLKPHPRAFEDAIFRDGLNRVFGTGWRKPTGRRQDWRYRIFVDAQYRHRQTGRYLHHHQIIFKTIKLALVLTKTLPIDRCDATPFAAANW